MLTKDLKKGTRITQRNGWEAKIVGSARGTTTLCEVYGFCTEMGSIYTHDMTGYYDEQGNYKTDIEFTKSQLKCKEMTRSMGW